MFTKLACGRTAQWQSLAVCAALASAFGCQHQPEIDERRAALVGEELQCRGDFDNNGKRDLTDAINILNWLFLSGEPPACEALADIDASGKVDLTDAVVLLSHLFQGGPPPAPGGCCIAESEGLIWRLAGPAPSAERAQQLADRLGMSGTLVEDRNQFAVFDTRVGSGAVTGTAVSATASIGRLSGEVGDSDFVAAIADDGVAAATSLPSLTLSGTTPSGGSMVGSLDPIGSGSGTVDHATGRLEITYPARITVTCSGADDCFDGQCRQDLDVTLSGVDGHLKALFAVQPFADSQCQGGV